MTGNGSASTATRPKVLIMWRPIAGENDGALPKPANLAFRFRMTERPKRRFWPIADIGGLGFLQCTLTVEPCSAGRFSLSYRPTYSGGPSTRTHRRRSAPVERLRDLEHALGVRVPALRRMGVVVQVAAHAHEPRAFGEGEMAAHRRARHVAVEFRQLRAVDEAHAPLALHMGAAVQHVVRMGVRMTAEPDVDRAWVCGEVSLECLRLGLVADKVKIRRALRRAVRSVMAARTVGAVGIAAHSLEIAGPYGSLAQHVMMATDDDLVPGSLDLRL